ncbi:STM2901 family protein [Rahnella sp. CJA17(1/100)]|uniref:STM2901 family protein n=1 Tax=Rahnella sp. CJA17(1/100) TaxID=2508951 RepID=UPI0010701A3E|nr:hypothetical protein [Rahnella sp. CJA17(1/100)]
MDTTETLGGTYFYHGNDNVMKEELFWLIFLESFSNHTGIEIETAATIIAGAPLIPKRKVLGSKGSRTSIASKMSRRIFKDAKLPSNLKIPTIAYGQVRNTNQIGTIVGRWVPYLGYAQAVIICAIVAKDTRDKYNLIAYPQDRIAWTYF